jgi:hypothetical protein
MTKETPKITFHPLVTNEKMEELEAEHEKLVTKYLKQLDKVEQIKETLGGKDIDIINHELKYECNILYNLEREVNASKRHIERIRYTMENRSLMARIRGIEEKNNCLRVRFYDWLATKLEGWAKSLRNHAIKISTPCAVKLPVAKKNKNSLNARLGLISMAKEQEKERQEFMKLMAEIRRHDQELKDRAQK